MFLPASVAYVVGDELPRFSGLLWPLSEYFRAVLLHVSFPGTTRVGGYLRRPLHDGHTLVVISREPLICG